MATFTSLDDFKDHKQYVALLKKALAQVKGDTRKRFLYFKEYSFDGKKFPLVLVDMDAGLVSALNKNKLKPVAEGTVSLTPKAELDFKATKDGFKRIPVKKYFAKLNAGLPDVFVPTDETDDEAAAPPSAPGAPANAATTANAPATSATSATPAALVTPATSAPPTAPAAPVAKQARPASAAPDLKAKLQQQLADLRGKSFAADVAAKKDASLDMADKLITGGKLKDAAVLLDKLATKVVAAPASPAVPAPAPAQASAQPPAAPPAPTPAAPKLNAVDMLKALKTEKDWSKRAFYCEELLKVLPPDSREYEKIEDLHAEALKEIGIEEAQAVYAAQMRSSDPKNVPLNLLGQGGVINRAELARITKATGLSEAEVMAVRAFTTENYKYINPAIANQKDKGKKERPKVEWMDKQKHPLNDDMLGPGSIRDKKIEKYETGDRKTAGSKKSLEEEGALHAGLMKQAFLKLPKQSGKLYRGMRMTPKDFKNTYAKGKVTTMEAFVSMSCATKAPRDYANGQGGHTPPKDATVSVFLEADVTDARDIMDISIFDTLEKEWLLAPGAKLRVERIEDDTQQDPGIPRATAWKKVYLTQIA